MSKKGIIGIIIGVIATVLIGACVYFGVMIYPKMQIGKEIANALAPILESENKSMYVKIAANADGKSVDLESNMLFVSEDEMQYMVIELGEHPIYIVDNLLFFENGKAYKISEQMKSQVIEYDELFVQIAAVYEVFDIVKTEHDTEKWYEVTVTGDQMKALLATIMPDKDEMADMIESLSVKMITVDGFLESIEVVGGAAVSDVDVQVDMNISQFQILESGAYTIPAVIKENVKSIDRATLFSLTEDLYRLLVAVEEFAKTEALSGRVVLHANLGILQMDKELDLAQMQQGLTDVENAKEVAQIPGLIALLCMEGDIRCEEYNGAYIYTLTLDQDVMKTIASSIVPEIVNYVVTLTTGVAEVVVEDGSIQLMRMDIIGKMNLLISEVPIEVGAEFVFE